MADEYDPENSEEEEEDQQIIASDEQPESERDAAEEIAKQHLLIVQKNDNDDKCATYVFKNEDYTFGNVLSTVLSGHSDVQFVGCTVLHPAQGTLNLRLQTGSKDTNTVLNEALYTIESAVQQIRKKFKNALKATGN